MAPKKTFAPGDKVIITSEHKWKGKVAQVVRYKPESKWYTVRIGLETAHLKGTSISAADPFYVKRIEDEALRRKAAMLNKALRAKEAETRIKEEEDSKPPARESSIHMDEDTPDGSGDELFDDASEASVPIPIPGVRRYVDSDEEDCKNATKYKSPPKEAFPAAARAARPKSPPQRVEEDESQTVDATGDWTTTAAIIFQQRYDEMKDENSKLKNDLRCAKRLLEVFMKELHLSDSEAEETR